MRDLAAVGYAEPFRMHWDGDREAILMRGANTLEWCDANDPDNFSEDEERVAELESALSDVRAAMVAWNTSGSTKRHAEFTKELRGILTEVDL